MPYVPKKDREETIKRGAINVGELNFLYTIQLARIFELFPGYTTIHYMKKHLQLSEISIGGIPVAYEILTRLSDVAKANKRFDFEDHRAARELAFHEFMRRVGDKYEDKKKEENGDVYGDLV